MESKTVILIGGSDPSGGAGIQADLQTLFALEIQPFSVVTAVTAQNEKKIISYETVSKKNFSDQLSSLEISKHPLILKIGMMGTSQHLEILSAWIKKTRLNFVILDPVLVSSTGKALLDKKGINTIQNLLPFIDLITPNIPEAEKLSGIKITRKEDRLKAGEKLLKMGAKNVLLKGGHFQGKACDILFSPEMNYFFEDSRIKKMNVHGTGCTLASAIAGYLALGSSLVEAIHLARKIVREKILKN